MLTGIIDWFSAPDNSVVKWIVIGALVVIVLLILLSIVAKFTRQAHHKDFPVDSREANLLALGFQQITNSANYWNDPTASLNAKGVAGKIRSMWGLTAPKMCTKRSSAWLCSVADVTSGNSSSPSETRPR